jgi:hypothetical protein
VELEIRPEPGPEERAVILATAEALLADNGVPGGYRSSWRELGIRENLERDAEEAERYGETGRPRSRPGATRA